MDEPLLTPFELYQRKDSPNYWMRFSVKGKGQVRIGLKTPVREEAEARAATEHLRYQLRAEDWKFSSPKTFEKTATAYVKDLESQVSLGLKKPYRATSEGHVVRDYLIPFFGRDRIEGITEAKVQQFIRWRQTYWIEGPGKDVQRLEYVRNGRRYFVKVRRALPAANTIRGNCAVLSNVFRFGASQGDVRSADIPKIRMPKVKPNPRPSFSLKEVNALFQVGIDRLAEPSISERTKYERLVLYCYVNIASYTGLRPVELHNLNWQHVGGFLIQRKLPIGEGEIVIRAFGKTEPRTVVPMEQAFSSFELLWTAFEKMHGREPTLADAVFCNFRGGRIRSFKKSLNALLNAAGLKTHEFGGARVAYSFRHFYISQQLLAGVGVFQIAKNAGTLTLPPTSIQRDVDSGGCFGRSGRGERRGLVSIGVQTGPLFGPYRRRIGTPLVRVDLDGATIRDE
uniref:tyrosine-type recombinase/integrase n=1 Tax=Devosia sp. TaxID=1871048 RepID=UPI0037C104A8